MKTPTDLVSAIVEVKRVTAETAPWSAEDIWVAGYEPAPIDRAIAIILNAVASDSLSPVDEPEPVAWMQRHKLGPHHLCNPDTQAYDDWSDPFPVYTHSSPVTAEAAALEHLQNVMGHIDTPIARRRLNINDTQPEWLVEARKYLSAKGEA